MRLSHAGQRGLVVSEMIAVDRWGIPMRQYPIKDRVRWFEGEVEHTEKIAWAKRKADCTPGGLSGGEERESKRRSPVGVMMSQGSGDGKGEAWDGEVDEGSSSSKFYLPNRALKIGYVALIVHTYSVSLYPLSLLHPLKLL
jgi:hypothetical protein